MRENNPCGFYRIGCAGDSETTTRAVGAEGDGRSKGMINKDCSVRTELRNGRYPAMTTRFTVNEDGHGVHGEISFWLDGDTKIGEPHEVSLRQGSPLGILFAQVDRFAGGCLAMTKIPGAVLDEHDLLWVCAWAGAVLDFKFREYEQENKERQVSA